MIDQHHQTYHFILSSFGKPSPVEGFALSYLHQNPKKLHLSEIIHYVPSCACRDCGDVLRSSTRHILSIYYFKIITLMFISNIARRALLANRSTFGFSVTGESTFLEMVSQYFDKAGEATGIPKDRLNFLKSPDYSLKFNIPFRTGTSLFMQTLASSRWSKPTECSIKLTDCRPRVEPDTPAASTCRKLRHSPAL